LLLFIQKKKILLFLKKKKQKNFCFLCFGRERHFLPLVAGGHGERWQRVNRLACLFEKRHDRQRIGG
jgi:hypothetical protein